MTKHIDYFEQEGIHIFKWKSANRRAVDTWMKWMTHIMIRDGSMGYMLLDFSEVGLPPVRYLSMQVRRWLMKHTPPSQPSIVAVVYPTGNMPFLIVARSYTATLGRGRPTTIQFFSGDAIDNAYDWLLDHIEDNAAMG